MASQLFYALVIMCAVLRGVVGQFDVSSCVSLAPTTGGAISTGNNFFGAPSAGGVYTLGTPVAVFLVNTGGNTFQSAIIQARAVGSSQAVGTFTGPATVTSLSCPGSADGTLVANSLGIGQLSGIQWSSDVGLGPVEILVTYIDSTGGVFQQSISLDGPPPVNTPPVLNGCPSGQVNNDFTTPTCMDVQDPSPTVSCTPPAGTPFGPGLTSVTCTCTDNGGLTDECQFNVLVVGQPCQPDPCQNGGSCFEIPSLPNGFFCQCIPPFSGDRCEVGGDEVNCPADIVVDSPPVNYQNPLCLRNGNPFAVATCTPQSGGQFNTGSTTVTCSCTGGASCTFRVTVVPDGGPDCSPNPCAGGAECREAAVQAGYTCHAQVGTPCA